VTRPAVAPWVCRLYPEPNSRLYVRVQVWPTKAAFLAHVRATCRFARGNAVTWRTQGTCGRVITPGSRCFAIVNLYRSQLSMRVVTHELFHATMAWAYRVGYDFAPLMATPNIIAHEERITYVNCELNRQFMVKALRPGGPYAVRDKVSSQ
jgi:hypothetical protein